MGSVPEQGRLEELPLPRLLLALHAERFGGALMLSRERVGKRFLFQSGIPVYAESNLASESLGVQLMDAGRIERSDYHRAAAYMEQHGCKEGTALLALRLLEPKALFQALKDQVRMRLVECFGWPHGEFFLDASAAPPEDAHPFRTDLYALLQEGLEAHWSHERVLADLTPRMERYPHPSKRFDRVVAKLARDSAVEALLEALDGSRTLWRAVQCAATPRAMAAAWVLDASGAVDYRDGPDTEEADPDTTEPEVEIVVGERPPSRAGGGASQRAPGASERPAGGAAARRAPDDRAEALRAEIEAKFERLDEIDLYTLLGVEENAGTADIRRAYLKAAKTYHPDALARAGLDAGVREKANRVFAEIGKAHAVLSDPQRRRDHDRVRGTRDTDLDANRLAQAESNYRKAEILMRSGNFRGAVEYLRSTVDLWPEECAYQSACGWALYKKTPSEPELAREHLERAARLDPDDGLTQFRLSVVARALGDESAAEAAAARAERLDR